MPTEGWICPKCGSGVAPGVERCPCVEAKRYGYGWYQADYPPADAHKDDAKVPKWEDLSAKERLEQTCGAAMLSCCGGM